MILERDGIYFVGRLLRIARIKNEFIVDVDDPEAVLAELRTLRPRADLFTFWQRYPETEPRHPYRREWDNWAVLPITTYDDWFHNLINNKVRAKIRKASRMGVEVKVVPLTDEYIAGVTRIFNETPTRQGKKFAHFGKTFQQVTAELRTEEARTDFIGAYYQGEMIGFTQQVYVKEGAYPFGSLSLMAYRDRAPNNALMAKAVEACANRGGRFLVYGHFDYGTGGGGLAEFKTQHGFRKVSLPRYYVALTTKGRISLVLNLHRGPKGLIPKKVLRTMTHLRRTWREKRALRAAPSVWNGASPE